MRSARSPKLLEAVVAYLDDGNAWAAERLAREPGWVLDAALANAGDTGGVFAARPSASGREIAGLRLGKKTEQLYAECERLHRQLDRYAYGPPPVRFTEEDVDRARAAGVLIEFDSGRPIIVDRSLYRELVKAAIKRTHSELESKAAAAAEHKKTQRTAGSRRIRSRSPSASATQLRELADQAHGANADLGTAHPAPGRVDPADLTVARFFVYALLGADHDRSPYTQTGERIARLAAHGVAGHRGAAQRRDQDPQGRKPRPPAVRLRRPAGPAGRDPLAVEFIDGAKTAGELYGGALVVIVAAEQHASRLVVPASQRMPATGARTRTMPPRRCASSPARTCPPRSRSSSRPSSAPTPLRAGRDRRPPQAGRRPRRARARLTAPARWPPPPGSARAPGRTHNQGADHGPTTSQRRREGRTPPRIASASSTPPGAAEQRRLEALDRVRATTASPATASETSG